MNNSQPTILLVDDERRMLSSLTRCLARLGVNLIDYSCPSRRWNLSLIIVLIW